MNNSPNPNRKPTESEARRIHERTLKKMAQQLYPGDKQIPAVLPVGYILALNACRDNPNMTHQQLYDHMNSPIYADFRITDQQIAAAIQDFVREK
jgi:hypothetical protein